MVTKRYIRNVGMALTVVAAFGSSRGSAQHNLPQNDPNEPIKEALLAAEADPIVGTWVSNRILELVRHNLDLKVVQVLQNDPDARAIVADLSTSLKSVLETYRAKMMVSTGLARSEQPANFAKELGILKEAAAQLGFPEAVRNNAHLFINGANTVNAFTYSPLLDNIDVVVYEGLLQSMDDSDVKGVFEHELGHIKSRHVLTGLAVAAIFKATGAIIIPEEKQDAFNAMVAGEGRELVKGALDVADVKESDSLIDHVMKVVDSSALSMRTKLGDAKVVAVGQSLATALANPGAAGNQLTSGPVTLDSAKKLKAAMVNLTRSQEVTADRWSIIGNGFRPLVSAMAKLAGGKRVNVDAVVLQAHEFMKTVTTENMDLQQFAADDHPSLMVRILQHEAFMRTRNYQIVSDPFLKALDLYVKLSHELTLADAQINNDQVETVREEQIQLMRTHYTRVAASLAKTLETSIINEIRLAETSPNAEITNTKKMIRYMDESFILTNNPDLGRPKRLFYELSQKLSKMTDNPLAMDLASKISMRVPMSSSSQDLDSLSKKLGEMRAKNAIAAGKSCPLLFAP